MSACSNALRVFSRTRVPTAFKTLAPFLYQTPTIQQWNAGKFPVAHRSVSFRSPKDDDDVPFEDIESSLPPSIDDIEPLRQTTITGSERAAFQKLYQTFNTQKPPKNDLPRAHEIDQIADEWYEEDEEKDEDSDGDASLDVLFDKVLAGAPAPVAPKKRRKPIEDLATLAASILKPNMEDAKKKSKQDAAAEAEKTKTIRAEERARVTALMEQAQTDRELWEILEREVLGMIRKLDLDGVKKTLNQQIDAGESTKLPRKTALPKSQAQSTIPAFPTSPTDTPYEPPKISSPDSRHLFANYPAHLYSAAKLLRENFPASGLPLAILPTIKSVGRSSFALGASTALYNLLIRTAWHQHASYDYVDELLHDMDNAGVEFDLDTLRLLDEILVEFRNARRGNMGWIVENVWTMEQFSDCARRLSKWRDVVAMRLGVQLQARAQSGDVVRRSVNRKTNIDFRHIKFNRMDAMNIEADGDWKGGKGIQSQTLSKHERVHQTKSKTTRWKPKKREAHTDKGLVSEDTSADARPSGASKKASDSGNDALDELIKASTQFDKDHKRR